MSSSDRQFTSELEETQTLLARTRAELLEATRRAALTFRLASTAHDLRNSVGFMTSGVEVLERHLRDMSELLDSYVEFEPQLAPSARALLQKVKESIRLDEIRDDSHRIVEALAEGAQRTQTTLKEFLDQARGVESVEFRPCDLAKCVRQALPPIQAMVRGRIELVQDLQPVEQVSCRVGHILRLVENLVLNGVQAIPHQGHVWVTLRAREDRQGVSLGVRDDGVGIPEEIRDRVFEPFFTTKPAGLGTGLGLSIVREIVDEHRGQISISSRSGEGTRVEVVLPNSQPAGRG